MHYMLTGVRHARPATNPRNAPDDFPCFGAVVNALDSQERRHRSHPASLRQRGARESWLPAAISLNAPANQVSANNHIFPGFFAGRLGGVHDPLFISQHANAPDFKPLAATAGAERLTERRHLWDEVEHQVGQIERVAAVETLDTYCRKAFELLTAPAARNAFELGQEPERLRSRYGATPFGQGCLLARRLIEAGATLVTVNWERDDAYWDTHKNNFVDLKTKLLPNLDQGMSALLEDLQQRGLLEETLVVCLGEFGRTPRINAAAGRDHWAGCNTVLLAGAGIPGGHVYGASDRLAAYPARDAVSPEQLAATVYHLLGIDPQLRLQGAEGRPFTLSEGRPVDALL
jgi:uncharacterized protein (DUF1501 family)